MIPTAAATLRVDFVADVICPFCWVGWARLKRALEQRPDVTPQIVWRPFQLDPSIPAEGLERKAYLQAKFPDPDRVAAMHRRIEDMGREDGLEFRFEAIGRTPNTSGAHRLVVWASAEDRQEAAIDALFAAYFRDGRDIGDVQVLSQIAAEAGMDAEVAAVRLARGDDAGLLDQAQRAAVQAGIGGVPFYIFDQKLGLSGAQPSETLLDALDQARGA